MNILLLPGMDGTGILFEPFVKLLPNSANIHVAKLIQEPGISFGEQANALAHHVKKETIIIGESYSGLIAHELASLLPDSIKHIVFAASFLEPPSSLSKLGKIVPKQLLNYSLYPQTLTKQVLFGKYSSQYLMNLFQMAMAEVPLDLLESRIKQISALNHSASTCNIPATYLQANDDILVSSTAVEAFKRHYTNFNFKKLNGSHFILQTNPKGCLRELLAIAA